MNLFLNADSKMSPQHTWMQSLLTDTVTQLCLNSLQYKKELKVQGLLGITTDDDIFLVQINEMFGGDLDHYKDDVALRSDEDDEEEEEIFMSSLTGSEDSYNGISVLRGDTGGKYVPEPLEPPVGRRRKRRRRRRRSDDDMVSSPSKKVIVEPVHPELLPIKQECESPIPQTVIEECDPSFHVPATETDVYSMSSATLMTGITSPQVAMVPSEVPVPEVSPPHDAKYTSSSCSKSQPKHAAKQTRNSAVAATDGIVYVEQECSSMDLTSHSQGCGGGSVTEVVVAAVESNIVDHTRESFAAPDSQNQSMDLTSHGRDIRLASVGANVSVTVAGQQQQHPHPHPQPGSSGRDMSGRQDVTMDLTQRSRGVSIPAATVEAAAPSRTVNLTAPTIKTEPAEDVEDLTLARGSSGIGSSVAPDLIGCDASQALLLTGSAPLSARRADADLVRSPYGVGAAVSSSSDRHAQAAVDLSGVSSKQVYSIGNPHMDTPAALLTAGPPSSSSSSSHTVGREQGSDVAANLLKTFSAAHAQQRGVLAPADMAAGSIGMVGSGSHKVGPLPSIVGMLPGVPGLPSMAHFMASGMLPLPHGLGIPRPPGETNMAGLFQSSSPSPAPKQPPGCTTPKAVTSSASAPTPPKMPESDAEPTVTVKRESEASYLESSQETSSPVSQSSSKGCSSGGGGGGGGSKEMFQCPKCDKIYDNKSKMLRHLYSPIHGGQRQKCDICGNTFACTASLNAHKKAEHMNRQIVCRFCGNGFKWFSSLKYHLKKTHGVYSSAMNSVQTYQHVATAEGMKLEEGEEEEEEEVLDMTRHNSSSGTNST